MEDEIDVSKISSKFLEPENVDQYPQQASQIVDSDEPNRHTSTLVDTSTCYPLEDRHQISWMYDFCTCKKV